MSPGKRKGRKPTAKQQALSAQQQLPMDLGAPQPTLSVTASPIALPPLSTPTALRAPATPVHVAATSLTVHEKYIVRVKFQNQVLSANASAYEKLFTQIWSYAYPGFRQVKPQGKRGDKKNDGYHTDTGEYYQVYAPEKASENVTTAIKKFENDLAALKPYWDKICPVRAFRFVFNDKYAGTFPEIERACARLKVAHGLDDCRVVLAADLENTLFDRLAADQILAVVGSIPGPEVTKQIDYRDLRDVIEHLLHELKPADFSVSPLIAPDFEDKLEFNSLGQFYASLLRSGNRHSGELDTYFESQGNFQRDQVHRVFKDLYHSARHRIEEGEGALSRADRIFVEIYQNAMPRTPRTVPIENAIFALMAYYFETCDIFEEPPRRP